MSNYVDISDRVEEILNMGYEELMRFYVGVVGVERVVKWEVGDFNYNIGDNNIGQ